MNILKKYLWLFFWILLPLGAFSKNEQIAYSVRVEGEISSAQKAIIKRAIRLANSENAKFLILDMHTPGGDLASTLEIMETLPNFKGKTICYINSDAISAGSFIACACDEIWFSPKGIMGAAAAVTATGGEIDESMKQKINSFLAAKVRSINSKNTRRADVQCAMNDLNYELKIAGKVLKPKGELLTITANEASVMYEGNPLLANGIAKDISELTKKISQKDSVVVLKEVKIAWAEKVAKFMNSISPILMGIGFFLLFLDIKAGTFGTLAILGLSVLGFVFVGANMAGLAGYEPLIVFILGAVLILAELLFFAGLVIPSLLGGIMIVGSLLWALADIQPISSFEVNLQNLYFAGVQLVIGLCIAVVLLLTFGRFIHRTPIWNKLVLDTCVSGKAPSQHSDNSIVGSIGITKTKLSPTGKVKVGDKTFDASSQFGEIPLGAKVQILAKKDFYFIVKKIEEA